VGDVSGSRGAAVMSDDGLALTAVVTSKNQVRLEDV
jgi:hypothetical protein